MASSSSSTESGGSTSSNNINMANNHAVIVSSSRYWFNYRHVNNALAFYQLCKSNGIPDENIILMLADDLPSNARNPFKNGMYAAGIDDSKSLYDSSIEIDYRGEDVTVENLVRVLLGRQGEPANMLMHSAGMAQPRRHLKTDENSNILIFLTGHGGDQFFKFQDIEEITSEEIGAVLEEMHRRKRYKEILLVADTCQAFTLGDHIAAPNVMVIGSSLRGESSYAHHSDVQLGLSVMERYTHAFVNFLTSNRNKHHKNHKNIGAAEATQGVLTPGLTIRQAMVEPYTFAQQRANIGFREDLMQRDVDTILLSDFFANNELLTGNSNDNNTDVMPTEASHRNGKIHLASSAKAIPVWPRKMLLQQPSKSDHELRRAMGVSSQRLLAFSNERPTGEYTHDVLPVYNPSDGPFLALIAAFIGLVLVLSRRK